jgi:hypothetical protein
MIEFFQKYPVGKELLKLITAIILLFLAIWIPYLVSKINPSNKLVGAVILLDIILICAILLITHRGGKSNTEDRH